MGTLCLDKISKEKMIKELMKGKKLAGQLQVLLLQKPFEEHGLVLADDLVMMILRSFTQTLSLLDDDHHHHHDDYQNLQMQANNSCNVFNSDGHHRRLEDSGESSKKRPAALKDRRGCYKRKKNSQTWTIVSSSIDDGNSWRKYGQKEILNSKYPRSYFRCTHKYVHGCRATRHVQRRDDDPEKYEITYIGHHSCKEMIIFPQIVTENSDPNWSSSTTKVMCSSSSRILTEVKQENKEETTMSTDQDLSENLSSLDSIVWEDFMPFQKNNMNYLHQSLDLYSDIENGYQFVEDELF